MMTIGPYKVKATVGHGGMASVYEVEPKFHGDTKRKALKVFDCSHGNVRELRKKFIDEAENLHRLTHPNLVKVHDLDRTTDPPYFVMDLIVSSSGKPTSLQDRIAERNICPQEVCRWFGQLCDVVSYIHENGLIHRDIKPGNILIDESDNLVLVDFGVAKIVDESVLRRLRTERTAVTGASVGTPVVFGTYEYLPPEVTNDPVATKAWDIWALGMTFFKVMFRYTWDFSTNDLDGLKENLKDIEFGDFWASVLPEFLEADPKRRTPNLVKCALRAKDVLEGKLRDFKEKHGKFLGKLRAAHLDVGFLSIEIMKDESFAENSADDCDGFALFSTVRPVLRGVSFVKFSSRVTEVRELVKKSLPILHTANEIIEGYDLPSISYDDKWYEKIECDMVAADGNLGRSAETALRELNKGLNKFSHSFELAIKQFELFEQGFFHETALEWERRRKQKVADEIKAKEDALRNVLITVDGERYKVEVDYEEFETSAIDYSNCSDIVWFHGFWYAKGRNGYWRSPNAKDWSPARLPEPNSWTMMKVIASRCILMGTGGHYAVSDDGESWRVFEFAGETDPKGVNPTPYDIAFLNDRWVMLMTQHQWCSYVKSGIFSDSTERFLTSSTSFCTADDVAGPWRYGTIEPFRDGVSVGRGMLASFNGRLVVVTSMDPSYVEYKHRDPAQPHFAFCLPDGYWSTARMEEGCKPVENLLTVNNSIFLQVRDGLLAVAGSVVYFTKDGRTWKQVLDAPFSTLADPFVVNGIVCVPDSLAKRIWVSPDAVHFHQVAVEHRFRHYASNGQEVLAVDTDRTEGCVYKTCIRCVRV